MSGTNVVPMPSTLQAHAKRIHRLMDDWNKNTLDLGHELKAARNNFPIIGNHRPGWHVWIKKEIGIGSHHANSLIRVAEKFGAGSRDPAHTLGRKLMVMLSSNIPESAEQEIIGRIKGGEKISTRHAAKIIKEHKFPKPTEANKIAKETGKPQQASDGYIYFGTSKDDAQAGEARRTIVYGIKDAIHALAEIDMSPINFIKFMLPHQRWEQGDEKEIEKARQWLNELAKEWNKWED